MNAEKREILRKQILQKIKEVKNDIDMYVQITKPISPDSAIGRLTRLEAMNSKSINDAALHASRQRLVKLELALTALYDSEFGYCTVCEEPIPFERLMIMPEAHVCVQCAQNHAKQKLGE